MTAWPLEFEMLNKLMPVLTVVAFGFSSSGVLAEEQCAASALAQKVDTYSAEPFGARAWRVMQGLGDPNIEASYADYGNWQSQDAWKKLTAELAPDVPGVQDAGYDCRLSYPLQILNERVQMFGKSSPYIKQWILAQARVLSACSGVETAQFDLPAPLSDQPAAISEIQNQDRDYQTASVAFYKDKTKAVELFRKIGISNSPHKAYARYNVANLLANAKNVVAARAETKAILADPSLSSVHAITEELQGYISNIEDTPAGWTELLDSTLFVLAKPASEIAKSETLKVNYARALTDISYGGITAKQDDWWITGKLPENPTLSKAIVDVSRKSPMATWMMAGQSVATNYDRMSWAMIGDKWNGWATGYINNAEALITQPVGLSKDVLKLLMAKPDDATRAAVWAEAKKVLDATAKSCGAAPDTAAAGQFLLQAVRLSALAGKFDEAYDGLLAAPLKSTKVYTEVIVPKLAAYILAIGDAEQGRRLRDKILTPAFFNAVPLDQQANLRAQYSDFLSWVAEDQAHWLDAVTTSHVQLGNPLMNLMPRKTLQDIAGHAGFTPEQKAVLLRAAWTRNFALGEKQNLAVTAAMFVANPKIKTAYDEVVMEFPKLPENRALLLTILRNPRFGILVNSPDYSEPIETARDNFTGLDEYDHNDKNWWCPLEPSRQLNAVRVSYGLASGGDITIDESKPEREPAFDPVLAARITQAREKLLAQHPVLKAVDVTEIKALASADSAPARLTKMAIKWAKASKGNDGAPEALALAVRATRFGCTWHGGHKAYSKPAQELLKAKFPKSAWVAKTPYWFDCIAWEYDKDFNRVTTCKPHDWPKDELPK